MTTPYKIDRSRWFPGPWDEEPEDRVAWIDEITGLHCLAVRNFSGAWCGYVAVPKGHYAHDRRMMEEEEISVHGGLTYGSTNGEVIGSSQYPDESDELYWHGFDCLHCDDLSPTMSKEYHAFPRVKYRTLKYVRNECAKLALQLDAMRRITKVLTLKSEEQKVDEAIGFIGKTLSELNVSWNEIVIEGESVTYTITRESK